MQFDLELQRDILTDNLVDNLHKVRIEEQSFNLRQKVTSKNSFMQIEFTLSEKQRKKRYKVA